MPFFNSHEKKRQRLLDGFRKNFLFLISDGSYPPHRQQRLFQWCQKAGLDWAEARAYVAPEATAFLQRTIERSVADGTITPEELENVRRLQRRLALADDVEPLQRLYDLVQRKIEVLLIERAAYLSEGALVKQIEAQINAYHLPAKRMLHLQGLLYRQHQYARIIAGQFPIITAPIDLHKDEACHCYCQVSFVEMQAPARYSGNGILAVTNQRVMVLASQGGLAIPWNDLQHVQLQPDGQVLIETSKQQVVISCVEPQYVSTLLIGGQRHYNKRAPRPRRMGKRLA